MAAGNGKRHAFGARLLWFAALWIGGVIALGAVAFLIRSVLF